MEWTLEHGGPESARLKLGGALTLEFAVELREVLRQAINTAPDLVIELDRGVEADLSCLQLLCSAHRAALSAGRKLALDPQRPESFHLLANAAGLCRRQGCTIDPKVRCMLAGRAGVMAKCIMTVDDSASIRQMVGFTLKAAGYEVVEAVDGADALAKLNGVKVGMIITDLNMPNMNGIELTQAVRAEAAHKFVPIVLLTTESQDGKKQEGRAAGATGWIVKPFKPEQLLAVVKKLIG